jgi:hypothetical protein
MHQQEADRDSAGKAWIDTGLVFITRHGTPIEPRNFTRSFDRRIDTAKVSKITVHGARDLRLTSGGAGSPPARGHADPSA